VGLELSSLPIEQGLKGLLVLITLVFAGGTGLATLLRGRGLLWTWALLGVPVALLLWDVNLMFGLAVGFASLRAARLGASWHRSDIHDGADIAASARARLGVMERLSELAGRLGRGRGWVTAAGMEIGWDAHRRPVYVPVGFTSGCHTLVLGATGSGKTVTQAWMAGRLIEAGLGAVVIDPKGDELLRGELQRTAAASGRAFLEWTPEGPLAYNPYRHGSPGELADKALAGETFTEPHYQRLAQRYLGHAIRTMHAAGVPLGPVSLMEHMDPAQLEASARALAAEDAHAVQRYLDGLGERQRRELGGVRDRLSILAESEARPWLDAAGGAPALDLREAVARRSVVYFRLDADRRMLLSQMIAAAIICDLITITAHLQRRPVPTAVLIDEFAAVAAEHTGRLFGKARTAGFSLILGTQELADLAAAGAALQDQVVGNLEALVAHRQNVPASAELIAGIAGTRAAWITAHQTTEGLLGPAPSGLGTRSRGHEYEIHPSTIKRLATGVAAVITPGRSQPPTIARIHHPRDARRR
jgi:hypothetical protein